MLPIALKRLYPNAQVEVFNAGISGNTTVDGLNRLDSDVIAHKPHLVTVMFGLNDVTRVPLVQFEANLVTVIRKCRDTGAEVMLCTPNSVADTPARPIAKLLEYNAGIRRVAEREKVPVVDCYAAYEAVRSQDPFKWLMLMSDEIHPNMMGHKLVAETIAQAISGTRVSLESEGPPQPLLPKTQALLKELKPIRIYAMPPYDGIARSALKAVAPNAQAEVTPWPVEGLTLPQIEESSKKVRELKPDLVIAAVPIDAKADSKEQFVRSYKWVLNNALSFGHQEWDCMAVVPSVTAPIVEADAQERDRLARALIWAQDIGMVERKAGDSRRPEEILAAWLREQITDAPRHVIDVGDRTQLFIDARFIAESNNVTLRMNPPVKAGPVIMPDKPWESGEIGFCVSVVQYEGEYKMWYLVRDKANAFCQCFARSKDGRTWEKPELGLIEYQGAKNNNIVLTGAVETTVFLDPAAPPEQRFKAVSAMYWPDPQKAGLYIWTSPDGLHWTPPSARVFPLLPDTANQAFYDTRLKKYVANIRVWDPLRKIGRVEMSNILEPWPFTQLEKPFYIWGTDKIPVPSREVPIVFGYDDKDPPPSDHYNAACIQYPWADEAYFMFPSFYRHFPEPPAGKWGNDGYLDIQMAVSRDGVNWTRPSREPYVPMGLDGSLDSSQLSMAVGVVRNGDALYQYYGGYKSTHGQPNVEGGGSIHRLEQRPDGFMSAEAPIEGGTLTTPAITFSGRRLLLNIDGSATGTGKVALLDADGKEIPGFALAECDEFGANSLSREVTWKRSNDLSAWAGKPARLNFVLKAMKLFAFRFAA
jgi:lysophospholipase L1-like esterase